MVQCPDKTLDRFPVAFTNSLYTSVGEISNEAADPLTPRGVRDECTESDALDAAAHEEPSCYTHAMAPAKGDPRGL